MIKAIKQIVACVDKTVATVGVFQRHFVKTCLCLMERSNSGRRESYGDEVFRDGFFGSPHVFI